MNRLKTEVSTREALKQDEIINELSKNIKGKDLKYCVSTYGCQMNSFRRF